MIMADVLKIVFMIVALLVIAVSYWLFFEALFPKWVRIARASYKQRPIKTFLTGALTGGPLLLFAIAVMSSGTQQGQIAGITLAIALTLVSMLGSAGLARLIGEGLPSAHDAQAPWRPVMRGGIVLSICCVLPVAGWFAVLPAALLSGFGAVVSTAWHLRRQRKSAAEQDLKAVEA